MVWRWVVKGGVALCLAAVVTCGVVGTVLPQAARPMVRFGTVGLDATYYLPIIMAMQKGYFEQEGIQTEPVQIGPDDNLVRAVAAGGLTPARASAAAAPSSRLRSSPK